MATELLRDKLVNLQNEINNFKLQLWQQEIIVEDGQIPAPEAKDEAGIRVYNALRSGLSQATDNCTVLHRKLEVRQPKYDALVAEQAALDAAAPVQPSP